MAKVTFSPIISDVRGKVGSAVFQGGTGGTFLKSIAPVAINKGLKSASVKSRMSVLSNNWELLTDEQRGCWSLYLAFDQKTMRRSNNILTNPRSLYIKHNALMLQYNLAPIVVPVLKVFTSEVDFTSVTVVGAQMFLNIVSAVDPLEEFITLRITNPLKATQNNFTNKLRYIIFPTIAATQIDITAAYKAVFCSLPSVGDNIGISLNLGSRKVAKFKAAKAFATKVN